VISDSDQMFRVKVRYSKNKSFKLASVEVENGFAIGNKPELSDYVLKYPGNLIGRKSVFSSELVSLTPSYFHTQGSTVPIH
jgi:hypothetical protein